MQSKWQPEYTHVTFFYSKCVSMKTLMLWKALLINDKSSSPVKLAQILQPLLRFPQFIRYCSFTIGSWRDTRAYLCYEKLIFLHKPSTFFQLWGILLNKRWNGRVKSVKCHSAATLMKCWGLGQRWEEWNVSFKHFCENIVSK